MKLEELPKLKVGDPVLMAPIGNSKLRPAKVVKVGRTLYHVQPDGYGEWARETFRIDTWQGTKEQVGHGSWITTSEMQEQKSRKAAAIEALKTWGLLFNYRNDDWTLGDLERLVMVITLIKRRGVCSVCGNEQGLRISDGMILHHGDGSKNWPPTNCAGWGRPPVESPAREEARNG